MKKVLISLMALFMLLVMPLSVFATEKETREVEAISNKKVNVYLFWGDGCGYCEAAKKFFASIEDEYGKYYNLVDYEVWKNPDNNTLKDQVADYFKEEVTGVPYIVIGDETFGGYSEEYNEEIIEAIEDAYEDDDYVDVVKNIVDGKVEPAKNYDTLIVIGIFVLIIGGFGSLIYFSRK